MTKFSKVILGMAIAMIASFASAANYYGSEDLCAAAIRAGKAVDYKPTGKSIGYGDARVAGFEKRSLEGDACVLLAAQPGKRWVFLKQGTQVYTKGAEIKMLAECQNAIFTTSFIKKDEPKVAAPCVDNCNTVVTQVITHVVKEVKVCETSDGKRFEPVGNECKFEPTRANVSVKVETKIETPCSSGCTPKAALTIDKKVARTDGPCVVEVSFQGSTRYIRLDPEKNTGRLMAMVVPRIDGDIDRSMPITYVGGENNIFHANKTCEAAVQGFISTQSYAPTTKRLKLPGCEFRKQV